MSKRVKPPPLSVLGKFAKARGVCWLCAQRGLLRCNQGKGRNRDAHCSGCRRWLDDQVAPASGGTKMVKPSLPHVVRDARPAAGAAFVVEQTQGEALYLPHWVAHSVSQTMGKHMVCRDGKHRKVVVSFTMWVNERLGGAALRYARTSDVTWKEGQVRAGGGINSQSVPPSAEALRSLQQVVDRHATSERLVDTPEHVLKLAVQCSLVQLGLSERDLERIVNAVTAKEWLQGGTLDAGVTDLDIQALACEVAKRLVGADYLAQNACATRGVSAVLEIDGGAEHEPLNVQPAFAVRVVGDMGRTGRHCHFQGVLNVVLAGKKQWTFMYPQ